LTYVRFCIPHRHQISQQPIGAFQAAYVLRDRGQLTPGEREWFDELDQWFKTHLKRPARFASSSRPNAPKRAISWLKLSAADHVTRMRELVALLAHKDVIVDELRTDRPGYVVYEDEHQVVAMPFSDSTV
jgi:hypothetical protein